VGGIGAARRIIERELAEEPPQKAPEDVEHL